MGPDGKISKCTDVQCTESKESVVERLNRDVPRSENPGGGLVVLSWA